MQQLIKLAVTIIFNTTLTFATALETTPSTKSGALKLFQETRLLQKTQPKLAVQTYRVLATNPNLNIEYKQLIAHQQHTLKDTEGATITYLIVAYHPSSNLETKLGVAHSLFLTNPKAAIELYKQLSTHSKATLAHKNTIAYRLHQLKDTKSAELLYTFVAKSKHATVWNLFKAAQGLQTLNASQSLKIFRSISSNVHAERWLIDMAACHANMLIRNKPQRH